MAKETCPGDGYDLQTVTDPRLGRTVAARYRLISRLGSGGMSTVYLARHVLIDRLVAVKTLRRELARDPVQRDRFIREARAVNRINHENIVEITDFGETDDGMVYLVMEYVPGEPLSVGLRSAPFSPARSLHIAEQIAAALGRAHQMGVVHRDLKPENVLLVPTRNEQDDIKILDFGIAKIMDAPSITGSQQIFGTPGYIAPEYIQSTAIDGRADLYSLGIILYEMTTGTVPFDYEYPGDLLVKHVTERPVPPSERHPAVELPMERLILRCLEKDPDHRFRDAYHFLSELSATRERLGGSMSWGGLNENSDAPPQPLARETIPAPPPDAHFDPFADEATIESDSAAAAASTSFGAASGVRESANGSPAGTDSAAMGSSADEPAEGAFEDAAFEDAAAEDAAAEATRPDAMDFIPPPPALMLPEVEASASGERRLELGPMGIERWRHRFRALRGAAETLGAHQTLPHTVAEHIEQARQTLVNLEAGLATVGDSNEVIESLEDEARDYRAILGRAIDQLAQRLSSARGDMEALIRGRVDLRARNEALRQKVKAGTATEGEADAVLWELATVEERLRGQTGECDALEAQLRELQAELESRNENMEGRVAQRVVAAQSEMTRLEALSEAIRQPLAEVEAWIREQWRSA